MGARASGRSFGGRLVAAVIGLGLAAGTPQLAGPAWAGAAKPTAKPAAAKTASATMLELDSQDAVLAGRLGQSLRRAFASRGLDDGRRDSLVELRLAMGCKNDEPACLARGGRALGVKKMIFGTLAPSKGGHTLALSLLAVEAGTLESSVRIELAASELVEATIDRTAERVASGLLGETVVPEPTDPAVTPAPATAPVSRTIEPAAAPPPPPPPPPVARSAAASPAADTGTRESKFWWGLEKPTPTWKWAAFGTSAGWLVISSTAAIVLSARTVRLRDKLITAANDSLVDVNPNDGSPLEENDVDPSREADICAAGREHPPADTSNPESVRNKSVVEICNRADGIEKGLIASIAVVGISLAATLVFTGLLVIHRRHPRARAAASRRLQPSFGASATGFGGGLSGRF